MVGAEPKPASKVPSNPLPKKKSWKSQIDCVLPKKGASAGCVCTDPFSCLHFKSYLVLFMKQHPVFLFDVGFGYYGDGLFRGCFTVRFKRVARHGSEDTHPRGIRLVTSTPSQPSFPRDSVGKIRNVRVSVVYFLMLFRIRPRTWKMNTT